MRIPLNWLKEFVDIDITPENLAESLIMSGTEVEILSDIKGNFENIVVGEILEIEKHPNADRLRITKTSVGSKMLQIVCGAPNIEVGQKVPVALVGAQIGEFTIKEAEIRGIKSHGMLCSEAELGISDDHSGIMTLDPRSKTGESLQTALGDSGVTLEAEITPNRGDLLSMAGIGREVAAILNKPFKDREISVIEDVKKTNDSLKVAIKEENLCRRYAARVISGIKIGPSPKWMQDRLASSGVRPINNIVDVTNYIMLEMGQPLHAFDLEKLDGPKVKEIIVRKASKSETIVTLDGVKRTLGEHDLVIADTEKPIAIAGVMGGENTEVTEKTTQIVLESANFDPVSVRKMALRLGLRSEASSRFEKGLPIYLQEEAVDRAAVLMSEISGGKILRGIVDAGEKSDKIKNVNLNYQKIEKFLGEKIDLKICANILKRLGFKVDIKNDIINAQVPKWRLDVSIPEDLLEEIARIYGYNNIPTTLPEGRIPYYGQNKFVKNTNEIREALSALGFAETYSYSFTKYDLAGLYRNKIEPVKIANPLSQDQEFMRVDLLGSMLEIAVKNKEQSEGKFFEISAVYADKKEPMKISGLVFGRKSFDNEIFYETKGYLEYLFRRLGVSGVDFENFVHGIFKNSVKIKSGDKTIGVVGILDLTTLEKFKLQKSEVVFFELDEETLRDLEGKLRFKTLGRYPSSQRDLSFTASEDIMIKDILAEIKKTSSKILKNVQVVDIYRGKSIEKDKKSIAVRFLYQSDERTLSDKEVEDDQEKIIKSIERKFGGILRDGS